MAAQFRAAVKGSQAAGAVSQQGRDDPLVAGDHPGPQGSGQPGALADEGGEQQAVRLAAEQQFGGQAEPGARAEQQVVRGALADPPAENALPGR
jgi:hypothetical protein